MKQIGQAKTFKYLVLEGDTKLNQNTKAFFKRRRKQGEKFTYKMMSPKRAHSIVTDEIKFGKTDFVTLEPTIYRQSQLNKVAHDLLHSWQNKRLFKDDERFCFEKFFIMNTKQGLARAMLYVGPDGIASIGGIISIIPTYVLNEDFDPILIDQREFFKMVRSILYVDDANSRFDSELFMQKLTEAGNKDIRIAKPDLVIPFVQSGSEVIADVYAVNHDQLIARLKPDPLKSVLCAYIHVYHGNKSLVFSVEKGHGLDHWDIELLVELLRVELGVYYPDYSIRKSQ